MVGEGTAGRGWNFMYEGTNAPRGHREWLFHAVSWGTLLLDTVQFTFTREDQCKWAHLQQASHQGQTVSTDLYIFLKDFFPFFGLSLCFATVNRLMIVKACFLFSSECTLPENAWLSIWQCKRFRDMAHEKKKNKKKQERKNMWNYNFCIIQWHLKGLSYETVISCFRLYKFSSEHGQLPCYTQLTSECFWKKICSVWEYLGEFGKEPSFWMSTYSLEGLQNMRQAEPCLRSFRSLTIEVNTRLSLSIEKL